MYLLLLILGVLLIIGGVWTLLTGARSGPRSPGNLIWGIALIVLGLILVPGGISLR